MKSRDAEQAAPPDGAASAFCFTAAPRVTGVTLGGGGSMSTDGREIGRRFLAEFDTYLKENIGALECNDIHEIYSSFFKDLKAYKGNSNNFTGLSGIWFSDRSSIL